MWLQCRLRLGAVRPHFHLHHRRFYTNQPQQQQVFGKFLRGKLSLITGSTSGIGYGIACALADAGSDIIIHGIQDINDPDPAHDNIRKLISETRSRFPDVRVEYGAANLLKPGSVSALINSINNKVSSDNINNNSNNDINNGENYNNKKNNSNWSGIDILVNNAGIQVVSPMSQFSDVDWSNVLQVNLNAVFESTRAVTDNIMTANKKWGRIINIASVHGLVASKGKCAYVASKHGVIGFSRVVALEHANDGITVNCICPGWVMTDLVKKQIQDRAALSGRSFSDESDLLVGEKQAMLSMSSTESIGGLAVFLCSEHAKTMTGAVLTMDGGWTAQ